MKNNINKFFYYLIFLIFSILRGIIIFFIAMVIYFFIIEKIGNTIDWDFFFSYECIYKIVVGGAILGILSWWINVFQKKSKNRK
ncbi:hypothetical protein PT273_08235 [Orbaceae bacterium ESL0727]|nr:hypothetical protein [Orbaceae bacterium ESL0727]